MQYHSKINIYFYFFSFVDFFFLLIVLYFHLQMKNHHAFIQEGTTIPFCLRPIPQDVQCFLLNALRSLWSGWKLTLWRPYVGLDSLLPDLQTSWKGIQRNAALVIAKGTDMRKDWRNYSDYIWVLWEVMGSSYHASGKKKSDTGCFMRADSLFGEARWGLLFLVCIGNLLGRDGLSSNLPMLNTF